jgi:membrane fusion protein (multidrug efflux system)
MSGLFRQEAIDHHARGYDAGDILRFDPRWVRMSVRLIIAAAAASLLFCALFSVDEYASGAAVVRIEGRRVLTAAAAGPVESIDVHVGQRVEAGDVLMRMSAKDEIAELARATTEYELQVARYLIDPHDAVAKQTLSGLRARCEAAKNAVDAKTVRAPSSGTLSDVRVKEGQPVVTGEVLCAVVPNDAKDVALVAMVPADYRPMLRPGLEMRFELDGFRYEYADVRVEEVSAEAIGSNEVARLLGAERDGAIKLDPGGKVFVTGRLPAATFTSEGQPYGYFDGLTGTAEVRVRRESILVTLIPALRKVFS